MPNKVAPYNAPVKPTPLPKSPSSNAIRRAIRATPVQRKRTMKNGGAKAETCVSILLKVLPKEDDYQRMIDNDCPAIDATRTYSEFVADQRIKAGGLEAEDCDFLLALCKRVLKNRVSHVDLEPCTNFPTVKVFLDRVSNFVTVNNR